MKLARVIFTFVLLLFITVSTLKAQTNNVVRDYKKSFLGAGIGLDYGGLGVKYEYLPIKQIGLFGGLGYNFSFIGVNVGGSFKILPNKNICPFVTAFYGYNGTLMVKNYYYTRNYTSVSTGVTFGAGVDFKLSKRGHKITTNILFPIRSSSFMSDYDRIKNDIRVKQLTPLLPVAISVGFNFAIN